MRDLLYFLAGNAFMGWLWFLHRWIAHATLPVILVEEDGIMVLWDKKK